jgi:hypothetical protein
MGSISDADNSCSEIKPQQIYDPPISADKTPNKNRDLVAQIPILFPFSDCIIPVFP